MHFDLIIKSVHKMLSDGFISTWNHRPGPVSHHGKAIFEETCQAIKSVLASAQTDQENTLEQLTELHGFPGQQIINDSFWLDGERQDYPHMCFQILLENFNEGRGSTTLTSEQKSMLLTADVDGDSKRLQDAFSNRIDELKSRSHVVDTKFRKLFAQAQSEEDSLRKSLHHSELLRDRAKTRHLLTKAQDQLLASSKRLPALLQNHVKTVRSNSIDDIEKRFGEEFVSQFHRVRHGVNEWRSIVGDIYRNGRIYFRFNDITQHTRETFLFSHRLADNVKVVIDQSASVQVRACHHGETGNFQQRPEWLLQEKDPSNSRTYT